MHKTRTLSNLLDAPLFGFLHISLEVALYILLAILAIVACFYNLGIRGQSHDECVHILYSRELYAGDGWVYDPWRHGPFLYHINALIYYLFGVSDLTARISTALFGVILVLLPALLRKELGRVGALAVSTMTLISPSTLYYARYIRNDIYMMVWAMLMTVGLFRFLDSRKPGWLYLGASAVMLALCTKETAYITGFIGFTFAVMLFLRQVLSAKGMRLTYVLAMTCLLLLIVAWIGLNAYAHTLPEEIPDASGAAGSLSQGQVQQILEVVILLIGVLLVALVSGTFIGQDAQLKPGLVLLVAYVAAIASLIALGTGTAGLAWLAVVKLAGGAVRPWLSILLQSVAIALGIGTGGYAWWRLYERARGHGWLPAGFQQRVLFVTLALAVGIFTVLYTTFFTNPEGLIAGTIGGIRYWLSQQEVKRASQPWYYYAILVALYEFLPMGLSLIAMAYYLIGGKRSHPPPTAQFARMGHGSRGAFVPYLIYWSLSAWLIYSWAGEKMPWMMVHVAQPMIVLSGRFLDDLFRGVRWREVWRRGGAVLALLMPLFLWALGILIGLPLFGQAFRQADDTYRWLLALAIGGGLFALACKIGRQMGNGAAWRVALLSVLVLGALFTVHYAWLANYVNYDTAREFLVYSHGTPDLKHTVRELKVLSRRLYGDETALPFAYTDDASWPFECYFTDDFPNRTFVGTEPTRANTNVPVLIVGQDEIDKTEPLLGGRYYRFDRKYLWFPHQDYYMNLSLAMPAEGNRQPDVNYFFLDMLDPEKRRAFLDVVLYRKYEQSLADWEPSNPGKFAFYVRKDLATRIWDLEAGPPASGAVK